ncbi:MAG: phosphatase PAP2 family protein [Spirochaetaceae bacterium]|jgi:membrane-associated phospholipid phosphatase|nr:phosphatase PAP2 family protein [Spirochaetaceae bacterium]
MRRSAVVLCIFLGLVHAAAGDPLSEGERLDGGKVPFSLVFYKIGSNTLHSFGDNYGLNFLAASLATYGAVESGIDWRWNRMSYNNDNLAYAAMPAGFLGTLLPAALPLGLYLYGNSHNDPGLAITGLALGQAAILGMGVTSAIKVFTGRVEPGIGLWNKRAGPDYSDDFAFGFFRRGVFNGWPSGHTATAFAMAAVMAELHHDKPALVAASYAYAAFIGFGMSLFAHWASDCIAGALLGYALGRAVGRSFSPLINGGPQKNHALYITPNSVVVAFRI